METDEIIQRDIEVPAERNRFYIYPNPIKSGGNISAGVHLLEEGYYTVQFTNQSGQVVLQKEIWIDAAAKVLNIDAPVTAAGNYFITLVSKKTAKNLQKRSLFSKQFTGYHEVHPKAPVYPGLFLFKARMELFQCFTQKLSVKVCVDFSGSNTGMAQHFLHSPEIGTTLH